MMVIAGTTTKGGAFLPSSPYAADVAIARPSSYALSAIERERVAALGHVERQRLVEVEADELRRACCRWRAAPRARPLPAAART